MDALVGVLAGITALFFLLLAVQRTVEKRTGRSYCVICVAFSLTWVVLLGLFFLGLYEDRLIIGILMGETVLGVFYTLEERVREEFEVFKLPFLLTLVLAAYTVLDASLAVLPAWGFLLILWVLFAVLYLYRENERMREVFDRLLECCRGW